MSCEIKNYKPKKALNSTEGYSLDSEQSEGTSRIDEILGALSSYVRVGKGYYGSVWKYEQGVVKIFSHNCFELLDANSKIDQSIAIEELVLDTPFNRDDFVAPEYALIVHKNHRGRNHRWINALLIIAFVILAWWALGKIKNKKTSLDLKRYLMPFVILLSMVELFYIYRQKKFVIKKHKITNEGLSSTGETSFSRLLRDRISGPRNQLENGIDGLVIGTIMKNQGESLYDYLQNKEVSKTNYKLRARAVYQVAVALIRSKVIHRDLKPSNILIDHEEKHRPCDLATLATNNGLIKTTEEITTSWYAAPEVRETEVTKKYSEASDVWALGAILCPELEFRSSCQYKNKDLIEQIEKIEAKESDLTDKELRILNNLENQLNASYARDTSERRKTLKSNLRNKYEYTPDDKIIALALEMTEDNSEDRPTMQKVIEKLDGILGPDSKNQ